MLSYKEKYPLFNKNRHLKMTDATTLSSLSGLTTGKIKGTFQASDKDNPNCIFSAFNENETLSGTTVTLNVAGLYPLSFRAITTYGTDLYFSIEETVLGTPDYFLDGNIHNYEVIIDGVNNRFVVDGTTYSGADLVFSSGSQTTQEFLDTGLTELNIGVARVKHGNPDDIGTFYTYGNIQKTEVYDSIDTLLYACAVSGNDISASAVTIQINNDILNLDMKNNVIDKSDIPKTITTTGALTFADGKYGEPLSSRTYSNGQTDAWDNTEEIANFSLSCWYESNGNSVFDRLHLLTNSLGTLSNFGSIDIMFAADTLTILWADASTAKEHSGFYFNGIAKNRKHFVVVNYDYDNKNVIVYLNGKNITGNAQTDFWKYALNNMKKMEVGNYQVGQKTGSPDVPNGSISDLKINKYLLSKEDIKAEYRKPK